MKKTLVLLRRFTLWSPFLTSIILVLGFYVLSELIFIRTQCDISEQEKIKNLCEGDLTPGPPDECEIYPPCLSNENYTKFLSQREMAILIGLPLSWIILRFVKRRMKKIP